MTDGPRKCRFQGNRPGGPNRKRVQGAVSPVRSVTLTRGPRASVRPSIRTSGKACISFQRIPGTFTETQHLLSIHPTSGHSRGHLLPLSSLPLHDGAGAGQRESSTDCTCSPQHVLFLIRHSVLKEPNTELQTVTGQRGCNTLCAMLGFLITTLTN